MSSCEASSTGFCVYEAPPLGDTRPWLRTTPSPGPYTTPFPITLPSCQLTTINVGNWCPGKVKFCKFLDVTGNGARDPFDPALGGWTFTIRTSTPGCATPGTVVATAVTNPTTGCTPELTVPVDPFTGEQNYCVTEEPPLGDTKPWLRTAPSPGPFNTAFPITVQGCGEGVLTVDVGNWCPGKIAFCKFLDVTGNGARDPSDPALGGWTFTVRTSTPGCTTPGEVVATGVTDPTTGCTPQLTLPVDPITGEQDYCVTEAPPLGDTKPWLRTAPSPGPFNTAFPITVQGCGDDPLTIDVGNWCPGKLTFCKFLDLNGSGTKEPEDPALGGWTFTIRAHTPGCAALGEIIATAVTDPTTGCTPALTVPVDPVTGEQDYCVTEARPLGDLRPWLRTTPSPGAFDTAFPITVQGCGEDPLTVTVGNWAPVIITGYKFEDLALWPWTSPHYVGPDGQQNEPAQEPVPDCETDTIPVQIDPVSGTPSPGIPDVTIGLFDATGVIPLLPPVLTDGTGRFSFGPFHFDGPAGLTVTLKELNVPAQPSECEPNSVDPVPDPPQPYPWPGVFEPTVAQSIWPCPTQNFTTPTELQLDLPVPDVANKEYGYNYFYNRQPVRIWGQICPETVELQNSETPPLPNRLIAIEKVVDAVPAPFPTPNTLWGSADGLYVVPELPQEPNPPNNNRYGTFRLTPSSPSDPTKYFWTYRTFCNGTGDIDWTPLPPEGYVQIEVPPGRDVRVDFCLASPPQEKRCFLPVTLTQDGWHQFCAPDNPGVPGGLVYNKFPIVFKNFTYFGQTYKNKVIIGAGKTVTFEGTTTGLTRMCAFFPQLGPCAKLDRSYVNPVSTAAGALAGELLALQLNIAYNDMRRMPRTLGYDLEKFILAKGLFKGKSVREVRNIANSVLGGAPPSNFGLTDCQTLVDILANINSNYEFVDINVFTDRGYLIPNRPFGQPDPPVPPVVP
jgi:hypothetical protein